MARAEWCGRANVWSNYTHVLSESSLSVESMQVTLKAPNWAWMWCAYFADGRCAYATLLAPVVLHGHQRSAPSPIPMRKLPCDRKDVLFALHSELNPDPYAKSTSQCSIPRWVSETLSSGDFAYECCGRRKDQRCTDMNRGHGANLVEASLARCLDLQRLLARMQVCKYFSRR